MRKSAYIFTNGKLSKKNNTILYTDEKGQKHYLPVENIGDIYVFGDVDLNARILTFLSQKNIMLHYFNYFNYYSGTFCPRHHFNSGFITLKQSEHYLDEKKRLFLAKQFVASAALNSRVILRYYNKKGKNLAKEIKTVEVLLKKASQIENIKSLMAIEGRIKEIYYQSFDRIINNEEFTFQIRTRKPPENRLNALISFANSIIYTAVLSEIYKTRLDPRIGYLHSTNFRKFSLNLDIAEIFKPVIGDRTIFSCLNKKILDKSGFNSSLNGIILNKKGKKKFLKQLEQKFETTVLHYGLKQKVSYRMLIRMECYKLEKHFIGEKEYSPFIMRW